MVSDPFFEADGIAVRVTTKSNSNIRVLRIPLTVLQSARGQHAHQRRPSSVANLGA
ncbi:MAG TPA: hypothetical protein VN176_00570 [Verrucomicrobiae bacterium]|nr:hypothetical protein [Verrucomicrobiae bacterium]